MSALAIDLVLAPVDGSEQSLTAVEYAVAIADRYGASVHVLYVHEESAARTGETDATVDDTTAFMALVDDLAAERSVELSHSAVRGFSPTRLNRHPGSVVLDAAAELSADFLVVPREPVSGDPDEVLGKAAGYVVAYASQPVLSV
jgi:nucleotide-binding universal stress UspA family protein